MAWLYLLPFLIFFVNCVDQINKKESQVQSQNIFMDGSSSDDAANGIYVASNSSIYLAGYTNGNLNAVTNSGSSDGFLMKLTQDGSTVSSVVFTKLIGTSLEDKANAVAVDSSDNIYVSGYTYGNLNSQSNNGGKDAFLVKYDSAGTILWTRLIGGTGTDEGNAVFVKTNGILVIGTTSTSLNGETSSGLTDAFIVEYDFNGNLVSTNLYGSSGEESVSGFVQDSQGNYYLTGATSGTISSSTSSNQGSDDLFIIKLNSSLVASWVRMTGNNNQQLAGKPCLTSDYLFLPGSTTGTMGTQSYGNQDMVVVQYDLNGNKIRTLQYGNSSSDTGVAATCQTSTFKVYGTTTGDFGSGFAKGSTDIFEVIYTISTGDRGQSILIGTSAADLITDADTKEVIIGSTTGAFSNKTNQGSQDLYTIFRAN